MNSEEILFRLGINNSAVKSGLQQTSAFVKGWATGLAEDLRGKLGRIFTAALFVHELSQIKDKILEIARISRETGANTNFVQSLMASAEESGEDFGGVATGITKFNKLLGDAKRGELDAIKTLMDLGIVTNQTDLKTINFTKGIHNLAVEFSKLSDEQKRASLLAEAFGTKTGHSLEPIFSQGVGGVDNMSGGNFFTKISSGSISDFSALSSAIKKGSTGFWATVVNILDIPIREARLNWKIADLEREDFKKNGRNTRLISRDEARAALELSDSDKMEAVLAKEADKEGISAAEKKAKLIQEQNEMLEKQKEIVSAITDRDKSSIDQLADRAAKLTGMDKTPRGLNAINSVTPLMSAALRIRTLEDYAKQAQAFGNAAGADRFQSEADRLRAATPGLRNQDRFPTEKIELQLEDVNRNLALSGVVIKNFKTPP